MEGYSDERGGGRIVRNCVNLMPALNKPAQPGSRVDPVKVAEDCDPQPLIRRDRFDLSAHPLRRCAVTAPATAAVGRRTIRPTIPRSASPYSRASDERGRGTSATREPERAG